MKVGVFYFPTDYGIKLRDNQQVADEWYPVFLPIGDITSANYLRFRALGETRGGSPMTGRLRCRLCLTVVEATGAGPPC